MAKKSPKKVPNQEPVFGIIVCAVSLNSEEETPIITGTIFVDDLSLAYL
jgi:hypothetical protein